MSKKSSSGINRAIDRLTKMGVFQVSDAETAGISRSRLSRLCLARELLRVAPGIYSFPDAKVDPETLDFRIACIRCGPDSVIGGLTALFYYRLIEEVPDRTWVIAPQKNRSPSKSIRLIRSSKPMNIGVVIEKHFRIVSPERAI